MKKICQNPDCLFLARHGVAATFRPSSASCGECGESLSSFKNEAPVHGTIPTFTTTPTEKSQSVSKKLLWTTAMVAAFLGLSLSYLPTANVELFEFTLGMGTVPLQTVTWMSIGITPFLSAFVVVECIAAIVPRWRSLRTTGDIGRSRLIFSSLALGIGIAAFQVAMLVDWLSAQSFEGSMLFGNMALVSVALLLGCFSTMVLGWGVQRKGLGNGFSVLIAAGIFREMLGETDKIRFAYLQGALPPLAMFWEFAFLAAAFGFAWLVSGSLDRSSSTTSGAPHLGGGLLGFGAIEPILLLPTTLMAFGWNLTSLQDSFSTGSRTSYAASFLIGALATSTYVWLLYRPKLLARTWAEVNWQENAGKAFKKLHFKAQLFTISFVAFVLVADARGQFVEVVGVFVLGAIARDFYAELLFRRAHGKVKSVRSLHRLALVTPYLELLQDAQIDVCPRGLAHRSLGHFFLPWVPVELLVREEDVEKANNVLRPFVAS